MFGGVLYTPFQEEPLLALEPHHQSYQPKPTFFFPTVDLLNQRNSYRSINLSERNSKALILPEELKQLNAVSKVIWLYLKPLGLVKFSQRDMAAALGFARSAVSKALPLLRDSQLLEGDFPEKSKGVFRVVDKNDKDSYDRTTN